MDKDSQAKKGVQKRDVRLFLPGLAAPVPAISQKPPDTFTILTTLPNVHSFTPPSSKQEHPQNRTQHQNHDFKVHQLNTRLFITHHNHIIHCPTET